MTQVLIVDDDEIFRTMLEEMVQREGYEVTAVGDGDAALHAVDQSPPDLIITDILMPEKDGMELMTELAQRGSQIPIIAISGGGRTINLDFLELAELMEVRATLSKPFTRESLRQAITEALSPRT